MDLSKIWRKYLGSSLGQSKEETSEDVDKIADGYQILEHKSLSEKYSAESSLPSHVIYEIPPYHQFAPVYYPQEIEKAPSHLLPKYSRPKRTKVSDLRKQFERTGFFENKPIEIKEKDKRAIKKNKKRKRLI